MSDEQRTPDNSRPLAIRAGHVAFVLRITCMNVDAGLQQLALELPHTDAPQDVLDWIADARVRIEQINNALQP